MPVFMVERDLQGLSMEQLGAAQKAAIETAQRMTAQGKPVRYIRSTFVPGDARCMCLFEAPRAEYVEELNDTARLPYHTIVEALDLTP
jgi:muconolactone delta-isomerase